MRYNRNVEEEPTCPVCHVSVKPSDYFCFNCGKNLHPQPPSTSIFNQIVLYSGSIFLPPLGILWGLRYLRQEKQSTKMVGLIAIALTLISLIVVTRITIDFINTLNNQVNEQIQNFQGF